MQRHTLILWKKADSEDVAFDELARLAYDTLMLFNALPKDCRPRYKSVRRRKDAKEFNWDYDIFSEHLKKGVNKDSFTGCVFEDLGYAIGFFSSMENNRSIGYSIRVGNTNPKLINSLIIDFPIGFNMVDKYNSDMLSKLFEDAVRIFKPYWGCFINDALEKKENTEIDVDTRTSKEVHWLTYWADEYAEIVGKEKLEGISRRFPKAEYRNGLLRLQELAFDADSEEDVRYLRSVREYLFGWDAR